MSAQTLREQKKQQTRQAISDAATRLFVERGFDRVTIAEIATAAGVAKMTVTNYYPRKEDLVLDLSEEFVAGAARAVAAGREAGVPAVEALAEDYLAAVERRDPVIGFAPEPFARMLTESPVLLARLREFHEQREAALAAALAVDWPPGDITPLAQAAQLGGALRVLFGRLVERVLSGEGLDAIAVAHEAEARRVFALLPPPPEPPR
ncbi:TetR/AcrR family transcriptional regulator [Streptomyces sp. NPDC015346]|uniref:TetR/AcrR family transcriptional regulator n=1 Tax=Streptomyces sp. NPDC015346 TaxID=3364954 RepID=UPI0037027F86